MMSYYADLTTQFTHSEMVRVVFREMMLRWTHFFLTAGACPPCQVHINLLAMESRKQAELLFALRAIVDSAKK